MHEDNNIQDNQVQPQITNSVQEISNIEESKQTNLSNDKPKSNGFLVTLLSILLLIACFIAGFFAYQTQTLVKELTEIKNNQQPTTIVTAEPTQISTATESGVMTNTEPKDSVSSEIGSLFEKINTSLKTNIESKEESVFYDIVKGEVNKTSWNLDLTSVIKGKEQMSLINTVLDTNLKMDNNKSAGGAGSSVSGYVGDNILCYLLINIKERTVVTCSDK